MPTPGYYPRELIEGLPWREYALAFPRLLADLPRTRARIERGDFRELPDDAQNGRYPRYYARNFHFQSEGYLGHTSAQLYDLQVELLFGGTADAMRRRLIPPVVRYAHAHDACARRPLRILDVACGTGHFLRMLGAALPTEARFFGLDLSPHYIARAREVLPRDMDVSLVCDNAEKLPFQDASFDVVTSVFLLHEIPVEVRARVLAEAARVLKPCGLAVVADSIQLPRRAGAGTRDPRLSRPLPRAVLQELRRGRPRRPHGRGGPARHRLRAGLPHQARHCGKALAPSIAESALARFAQLRAMKAMATSSGTMKPSSTSTPIFAERTWSESAAPKQVAQASRSAVTGTSRP